VDANPPLAEIPSQLPTESPSAGHPTGNNRVTF
jgi:hypothetical protein